MSDCDGVTKEQPAGLPVLPWELVQRIDGLESKSVTHAQLRAAMVLVESLVTRVDALEVRVTEQEKRPTVKSRAEYMRKYRAKGKPNPEWITVQPCDPPVVTDTPPA